MKQSLKKYKVIIEKTDSGYSAMIENYPVYTTGKTIENLSSNILEALNLYLEDFGEKADFKNIILKLEFKLFFQDYKVLNAKFLAKRIGMNPSLFSQYVQGKKSPSSNQVQKILKGIHHLGEELKALSLVQ